MGAWIMAMATNGGFVRKVLMAVSEPVTCAKKMQTVTLAFVIEVCVPALVMGIMVATVSLPVRRICCLQIVTVQAQDYVDL